MVILFVQYWLFVSGDAVCPEICEYVKFIQNILFIVAAIVVLNMIPSTANLPDLYDFGEHRVNVQGLHTV